MGRAERNELRQLVAARYGPHCVWCGHHFEVVWWATLEHLYPQEFGGDNSVENLRLACKECNNDRQTWYQIALSRTRSKRLLFWMNKPKRRVAIDVRNGM